MTALCPTCGQPVSGRVGERLTDVDEWADVTMEALRSSDNGNNPFYSDDEDTISLARELAEAIVARLREVPA